MESFSWILDFGITDALDIFFTATLIYALLLGLRKTKSSFVFGGMLFLSGFYVVALTLGLRLTSFLFQVYFTVVLMAIIVIFQEEIRGFFERIAVWAFQRKSGTRASGSLFAPEIEVLVTTLTEFARDKTGALIVLQCRDEISRHLRGGVTLDGALSEPLLKSIFDPHSIGHDGALVLIGKRVTQFAAHLPLSADMEQLANRGTRHAAALGLAERTDALCLVVSEERGAISIAKNGALRQLSDSAALRSELEAFKRATGAGDASANWSSGLFLNIRLKGAALGVALAMWFLFVHESVLEYRSFLVPVQTTGLPQGLTLERGTPRNVKIIVSGARRAFYFVGSNHFQVVLKLFGFEAGVSEATVTASDLSLPDGVEFVNVFPRNVQLTISAKH